MRMFSRARQQSSQDTGAATFSRFGAEDHMLCFSFSTSVMRFAVFRSDQYGERCDVVGQAHVVTNSHRRGRAGLRIESVGLLVFRIVQPKSEGWDHVMANHPVCDS